MKKIFSIFMVLLLVLSILALTGCSKKKPDPKDQERYQQRDVVDDIKEPEPKIKICETNQTCAMGGQCINVTPGPNGIITPEMCEQIPPSQFGKCQCPNSTVCSANINNNSTIPKSWTCKEI